MTLTDGATVGYRLKVTNTGKLAGLRSGVTDKLPSRAGTVTTDRKPRTVTEQRRGRQSHGRSRSAIAAGASDQLGYTPKLVPVKGLKAGQAVDNHATVPGLLRRLAEAER